MKTIKSTRWLAVAAAVLTAAAFRASADQPLTVALPVNHYTGTVAAVDPADHTLTTKGFLLSKKFNLGGGCTYALLDKNSGAAGDLCLGEKITVSYQDAQGVLIVSRVEQQPMRLTGMVKSLDPATRTLTLQVHGLTRTIQIASGCCIVLRDHNSGMLSDIQTGNHVTVNYETPGSTLTAREIAQTSIPFTGTLTAIDLGERTVKAKSFLTTMKFNLAANCAIVINGKPDGKLDDLKPNSQRDFNYDEINGVNVVNRIATATAENAQSHSVATTAPMGVPMSY
jgi:Cu/Ag efflux protein CusF